MTDYDLEIHRLLGLSEASHDNHEELDLHAHDMHTPSALPISEDSIEHDGHGSAAAAVMPGIENIEHTQFNWKSLVVYPVIFLAAFAFFYLILNFSSIWSQLGGMFTKPQSEQILGEETAQYYKWISNYFYAVDDPKLLEPTNDIDKDGLTNHDEFTMRTNPILADSDNDGFSDGIEVINSQNPWGSGSFTSAQKKLAENLDVIMVNNRLSFNVSQTSGVVAGTSVATNYDLEKPGRLSIPKLKMQVPLIWSKDPSNFETDLTQGVIHYPGTALPGENGIIYVSGHSSDYIWKRDPMHDVFAKLNYLAPGDDIFIDVYGKDGKVYNFRYQVSGSHTYKPDDQTQFIDSSSSKLNLSTCWPIGTQKDRLVVTAVPVGL